MLRFEDCRFVEYRGELPGSGFWAQGLEAQHFGFRV